MNGITNQGNVLKGTNPSQPKVESVPAGGSVTGITTQGVKVTSKSSQTSGFSASRKCGSVKGSC